MISIHISLYIYPQLTEVKNIINSEDSHREQIGTLLDSRNISRPTDYGIYSQTYIDLKKIIDTDIIGAIEVWIMIEIGDIEHLLNEYKIVDDIKIREVFENIGWWSYNHLRTFMRLANNYNYLPKIKTENYLSINEVNQSGSLKYKMTKLLEFNNLPTYNIKWSWKNHLH